MPFWGGKRWGASGCFGCDSIMMRKYDLFWLRISKNSIRITCITCIPISCRGTHQSWPVIRGESRHSLGSVDRLSRWLNMEHGPAPDSDTVGITKHQTIKRNASDAWGDLSVTRTRPGSQVAACPRPIQIFREPLTLRAKGSMGAMESVGIHWNPRWNHATCDMECMGIACTRHDLRLYCDASDPWHAMAARRGSTKPPVNSACAKVT